MSPSRYQVEADSVDELNARILQEYGPDAAVVATTVVTTGGLQGFFASRKFQATVELADGTSNDAHAFDLPARAGIAALLDSADYGDAVDELPSVNWTPSTTTVDFAAILADLTLNTARATPAIRPSVPAGPIPLRGAGDLVVVVGLGDDSLAVATAIANGVGASILRVAGTVDRPGVARVDDRREAIAARAEGVRRSRGVVVAFGLPRGGPTGESAIQLENLHADQVWVAVDAGRKPDDTARWVTSVAAIVPVAAVMSWAPDATSSPHSVSQLGFPVGWLESGW